jgi:hypothetical protein
MFENNVYQVALIDGVRLGLNLSQLVIRPIGVATDL